MSYIFGFIGLISIISGFYFYAKKRGRNDEKMANMKELLRINNVAKKQADSVDAMSNDAVRDGLRKYTRD